jgi:hypothetical protein
MAIPLDERWCGDSGELIAGTEWYSSRVCREDEEEKEREKEK